MTLPSIPLAAPPPQRWVTPPQLVIADDHEETLVFYRERLAQAGCTLAVARTGAEALAQVRATRPDVAILDIQMPELDGLTAIRQIRADAELEATPIIALTALAMPGDRERCLEAGANIYLAKPVSVHLALRLIPPAVLDDCRTRARELERRPTSWWGAALVVAIWLGLAALAIGLLLQLR